MSKELQAALADNNITILSQLPHAVQGHVRFHLGVLREHERALDSVIACRGKGYNLALELNERLHGIKATQTVLLEFRALAAKNGVDGDAVIAVLGGEPLFDRFGVAAFAA